MNHGCFDCDFMNEKSGRNRHNHVMIISKFWFSGDFNFLICNKGWWRYWIISKVHFSKESLRITDWAFPVVHYVSDSAQNVVLAIDRYPINICPINECIRRVVLNMPTSSVAQSDWWLSVSMSLIFRHSPTLDVSSRARGWPVASPARFLKL